MLSSMIMYMWIGKHKHYYYEQLKWIWGSEGNMIRELYSIASTGLLRFWKYSLALTKDLPKIIYLFKSRPGNEPNVPGTI